MANECSTLAKRGMGDPREALSVCTIAIEHDNLTGRDLAGTYVNRGVLRLRGHDWFGARQDFDTAASIAPGMGEALINRGASFIAQKRWAEGVADIDHGLALNPEEPEKAYYNRAIAKEHLDDMKGAYFDYLKAAELAPAWAAPQAELKRFTVAAKSAG
jgi:tetratricopeptide (TPR) repeat protein